MSTSRPAPTVPTRDPFTGEPLTVTRLVNPETGTEFSGSFSLGWMGRLTNDQLDFVGLLLARRANLQKLAADLGVAYNTVRNRFEEIVRAVSDGAEREPDDVPQPAVDRRRAVLQALADHDITVAEAKAQLADG